MNTSRTYRALKVRALSCVRCRRPVHLSLTLPRFTSNSDVAFRQATDPLCLPAPPEAPVIEGVQEGKSVTRDNRSKVSGRLLPVRWSRTCPPLCDQPTMSMCLQVATCETRNGYPRPTITWYRNQVPLIPATERERTKGLRLSALFAPLVLRSFSSDRTGVNVLTLVTRDSRDFYSVESTLEYKVRREDKDAHFSCEVTFSVPGAVRTMESSSINITVHCKFTSNHQ